MRWDRGLKVLVKVRNPKNKKMSLDDEIKIKGISIFGPPVVPFILVGSFHLTDSGQIIIPICRIRYLFRHFAVSRATTLNHTARSPPFPRCPRSLSPTFFLPRLVERREVPCYKQKLVAASHIHCVNAVSSTAASTRPARTLLNVDKGPYGGACIHYDCPIKYRI